jgi:hypothetical protein
MKQYKRDGTGTGWIHDGEKWTSCSKEACEYIEKAITDIERGYVQSKTAKLRIQPLLRAWCNKKIYKLCCWLDPFKEDRPGEFK